MSDVAPKKKLIRWSFKRADSTPTGTSPEGISPEEAMPPSPPTPSSPSWGSTCPICFKNVKSMKILPCKHEFCPACLENIQTNTTQLHNGVPSVCSTPCPICRQPCGLEDLEQLPSKLYGYLPCTFCTKDKPVEDLWWCSQCVKILCSRCAFKYHRKLDGHPEPEPWDSLRALEQACYVLGLDSAKSRQTQAEEKAAKELDETIAEMDHLRQNLVSFFGDVVDIIMNQVAEEEFADAAQATHDENDIHGTVTTLLQQHFGLKRKVCRIPRDRSTTDLQEKLLAVSKMALGMIGVSVPDSQNKPDNARKKTANVVKSVLLVSSPKDIAAQLTSTEPKPLTVVPPALPKRRIRSVNSMTLAGCMTRDQLLHSPQQSSESETNSSSSDDAARSPPIIREKRRLTVHDARETILGEMFQHTSLKVSNLEDYCLAYDSKKAILWKRGQESCHYELVLRLEPFSPTGEIFLAAMPLSNGQIWSLEGSRSASTLVRRGNSSRTISVARSCHDLLAVSSQPDERVVTGKKGCGQIWVSEVKPDGLAQSQVLDLETYEKQFALVSLSLSTDGSTMAALNGTSGFFLFTEAPKSLDGLKFQLIRSLSFADFGMDGVVSLMSQFHQFQFLSGKDHPLLVIKTQSGVAVFSVNYLRNPTYALETSPGTDYALVARRQKEVMRIQEFLGHPWGFQALQKSTQVISVTGLEVPCKFLGHWQGNLICPSSDKIKVAGVQLRPTA